MKPKISILAEAFVYRPSYATAVTETWRRFGGARQDAKSRNRNRSRVR